MMGFIGQISDEDLKSLAPYRARPNWECSRSEQGSWWVKVPTSDEVVFSKLPLLARWEMDSAGNLHRPGHKVPELRLAEVEWKPIASVITISGIKRSGAGLSPVPIGFRLVATDDFRPASAILCKAETFFEWSENVLAQRIECLRFCLSDDSQCIVKGDPLPGIEGQYLAEYGRLLMPAGYGLPDFLWPDLVVTAMKLEAGDSAMIYSSGDWEVIPQNAWESASRSTIRINGK